MTGEPGTPDAGEPTVLLPGSQVDLNPLACVKAALADAAAGLGDPAALAALVEPPGAATRYARRLVLQVRGGRSGLLRRSAGLDVRVVRDVLGTATRRPVDVPDDGTVEVEAAYPDDPRAPRLSGLLTPERVDEVLRSVALG